jgi:hypothetical protein
VLYGFADARSEVRSWPFFRHGARILIFPRIDWCSRLPYMAKRLPPASIWLQSERTCNGEEHDLPLVR